ncbi:hypothetical protein BURCENK562V_C3500 [Burkholderia cenocepacia K56-2Valvano]|nr:hypothetical protein BURCENK562V_C3500 [Burkholderia cenocepacia K56-2Valvano]
MALRVDRPVSALFFLRPTSLFLHARPCRHGLVTPARHARVADIHVAQQQHKLSVILI